VCGIVVDGEPRDTATAGEAATLVLDSGIDVGPGDLLAPPDHRPELSDQIAAHLSWLGEEPLLPGRPYHLQIGARAVGAAVSELKHRVEADTSKTLAAKTLTMNQVGFGNLSLAEPIAFDPFDDNPVTGSFVLIDRFSGATVAAGKIRFGLRRATNIHWQALDLNKQVRAEAKGQRPCLLWFTGLSGAGKSTIANLVEKKLHLLGRHTYLLDGDNVRHGLNRDLGFTDADRVENIRRVAEAAKLFVDAGLIVITSFISPFRSERNLARDLVAADEFLEVYVDVPLAVAEARDPKGLYKKARAGKIQHFTGIDSPYEVPLKADIHLDTTAASAEELAEVVVARLKAGGYLGSQ
jgi:bifunctional enzyme CysN/CysC